MSRFGLKRKALVVAVAVGILGAVVVGRVVLSSRAAYQDGQAAERRALATKTPAKRRVALERAIVCYRRAGRWYAPGNGYVIRALDRLEAIGRLSEGRGETHLALEAYRGIRRAILGARSVYTPHADRLARANTHIARLSAAVQGRGKSAREVAALEAWHRNRLARDTAPSVLWSVLALLGFLGWVGGAVGFIYRAITPEDRLLGRPAIRWGLLIAASLAVWLLGLSLA